MQQESPLDNPTNIAATQVATRMYMAIPEGTNTGILVLALCKLMSSCIDELKTEQERCRVKTSIAGLLEMNVFG